MYDKIQRSVDDYNVFKKIKYTALLIIFAVSVFWVVCTQFIPGVDEGEIQQMIHDFTQKDYYMFAPTGYLDRYHHNIGLFWYEYFISLVFGSKNYLVYELINSFAIAMIYKQLSEIGEVLGVGRLGQLAIILFGIIFLPLTFYSILVYGNIIGLVFSVTAVKYELQFFESMSIKKAVLCAFFISLALCLKSTVLIYFLAITICALIKYITTLKKQIIIFLVMLGIGFEIQSTAPVFLAEKVTGYELNNPVSFWVWIAMGLQESELAPGWWNGYEMTSYWENECDILQQKNAAIESVKCSIRKFVNDPDYAFKFFTKKITSTWANPSFQCFGTTRNGTFICNPKWLDWLLSYQGQYTIMKFWNVLEFCILFGSLLQLIFGHKRKEYTNSLILPMILIGGFIYLMFSETKARYALLFFVSLIPFAAMGYTTFSSILYEFLREENKNIKELFWNQGKKTYYKIILCLFVLSVCIAGYGIKNWGILTENTKEYFEIKNWDGINEFNQYLKALNDDRYSVYLAVKDIQGYSLTEEHINNLKNLGFDQADQLLDHNYHNFIGVLYNGNMVYQYIGNNEQHVYENIVNGDNVRIESATLEFGDIASIKINDTEYAMNGRGINIVIVENNIHKVVDSVSFDTHLDEIPCNRR